MSKKAKTIPRKEAKPHKTSLFRLYPTHRQIHTLEHWLGLCCQLYNAALDERKSAYRMAGISLSYEDQCAELPDCKEVCPDLANVPSQALQDVVKRVDLAFEAFFRRIQEGQKPGYPRFVRCSKLRVYRVEGRKRPSQRSLSRCSHVKGCFTPVTPVVSDEPGGMQATNALPPGSLNWERARESSEGVT